MKSNGSHKCEERCVLMDKLENFINVQKLNSLLKKQEEEEKKKCGVCKVLVIVGIVIAVATLAYGLYKYLKPEYLEDFDDDDYGTFIDMPQNVSEEDILKYVQFDSIIIEEECREDRIEFHAGGGCDWKIEHGFEFTVSDGKILYVGPFEDMPPNNPERFAYYGFYDENADPIMNYADKEI